MSKIYISGAITGHNNFYEKFKHAELWLKENGYDTINPAKISIDLPNLSYEDYMKIDYTLINIADCVFMLDGWQKSKGACAELSYAKSLGKKILYQDYFKKFRKNKKESDNEERNCD